MIQVTRNARSLIYSSLIPFWLHDRDNSCKKCHRRVSTRFYCEALSIKCIFSRNILQSVFWKCEYQKDFGEDRELWSCEETLPGILTADRKSQTSQVVGQECKGNSRLGCVGKVTSRDRRKMLETKSKAAYVLPGTWHGSLVSWNWIGTRLVSTRSQSLEVPLLNANVSFWWHPQISWRRWPCRVSDA